MISFVACLTALIAGYFLYGKYLEKVFQPEKTRTTPAFSLRDGVDYVPMPTWKIFLIQFLNIAGLGPIFGAVMGAMYGPVVFLWITLGTIFAGGLHDYFSGMISERYNGESLPELVGRFLGIPVRTFMRFFTIILMVLVGAVFVSGPADILDRISGGIMDVRWWMAIIFCYYIVSTIFPIDKIIGRIYPVFGFALFFMAVGILVTLIPNLDNLPELNRAGLRNLHPEAARLPIFPMMFITVACGAISGFHATQSPLMARCMKNECDGRKVFYGAMVAEGCVALIWAAAGMAFFGGLDKFQLFMSENGNSAAIAVDTISRGWLGKVGGVLALLGVVAAPITSADTAFRSGRLIMSDLLHYDQKKMYKRILLSFPLFAAAFVLLQIDFEIIWRYFAWCNQSLAVFTLWAISVYLFREGKNYFIALLPALFMTVVCTTYILTSPEGFRLNNYLSVGIGLVVAICFSVLFFKKNFKNSGFSFKKR